MSTTRDETQPCCPGTTAQTEYVSAGQVISLGDMPVYVVGPATAKIGIVMNYDIFGLDLAANRSSADRLAESTGYVVVMGDYFRGNAWKVENFPPPDGSAFMTWVTSFSDEQLAADLEALRKFLAEERGVSKIGVIGFCWGGKTSVMASKTGQFHAAASMHGAFIKDEDGPEIKCPILMIDAGSDPDRSKIAEVVKANPEIGPKSDFVRYNDMEHGWVNRGDKSVPRIKECMDEAFEKAKSFFRECLE